MELINSLIEQGWLKTPRVIEAFKKVKRQDFMPEGKEHMAEWNEALPIGYGQTISQPLVVAFMMELLKIELGDKVLDIGSGSGWTSALLGELVGPKGKVIAIEVIPELKEFGQNNAKKYNFNNIEFICTDGSKGYVKEAPFDKILCSAEAKEVSKEWKEQLKKGGIIVTPIGSSIWVFEKNKEFHSKEYPGFSFVPLINK